MANNPFISDTAANAAANAVTAICNGGTLNIYSGTQPTNANTALSGQTLLATMTLSNPAFGSASAGVATANAIGSTTALASGTGSWFRVLESNGTTVVFDGSVGTSGCDLNLNSVSFASGEAVSVTSFTYTQTE